MGSTAARMAGRRGLETVPLFRPRARRRRRENIAVRRRWRERRAPSRAGCGRRSPGWRRGSGQAGLPAKRVTQTHPSRAAIAADRHAHGQPGPIGGAGALQRRQATGARRAVTGDHEPQASVRRVRGRDQPQECIDQCRVVAGSVHGARAADHENAVAMAEQLHEAIAGASGAERIDDMDNQPRRPCAPIERSSGRSGRPCMADMTDGGRCHGLLHAVR
jgi:hypothetical protein